MATQKITKSVVDGLRATGSPYFIWDETLKRFGVKVTGKGRRVFVVQFRPSNQRRSRRLTLGPYGPLTVDQARRMAQEALGSVAGGYDPAHLRKKSREAPTVGSLVPRYIERQSAVRAGSTVRETDRCFAKYILPKLGSRKVELVEHADVAALHSSLRSTPYQANRAVAYLSAFMVWCEKEGLRPQLSNPCRGIDRYREAGRERYLGTDELASLGAVLTEAATLGLRPSSAAVNAAGARGVHLPPRLAPDPDGVDVIRLLLFTGARKGEVLSLRWAEVDLDRGQLTLAATKTGKSVRFLSDAAKEILANRFRRRHASSPYVFPGSDPKTCLKGIDRLWDRVRKASGLDSVRLHDLRHTFASVGASGGMSLPLLGRLLGHSKSATTARYAHLADDPAVRGVQAIGLSMVAALVGATTQPELKAADADRRPKQRMPDG